MSCRMRFSRTIVGLVAFLFAGVSAEGQAQGPWAVYVMNADGSEVQTVRYDPQLMFGSPAWLHDGKRIVFISDRVGS